MARPTRESSVADTLADIALYLQRLGHDRPPPPTLDTLRALQLRHTATFPFETLSTLLRAPVPIDLPAIQHKLLHAGRGGYCYEHNGVLRAALQARLLGAARAGTSFPSHAPLQARRRVPCQHCKADASTPQARRRAQNHPPPCVRSGAEMPLPAHRPRARRRCHRP